MLESSFSAPITRCSHNQSRMLAAMEVGLGWEKWCSAHPLLQQGPGGLSVRSGSLTQQISCWLEPDTPLFLFHFIYKVTCKSPRIKFQGFFFSGWDETWGWGQVCVCVSLATYCQRNVKMKNRADISKKFRRRWKKSLI